MIPIESKIRVLYLEDNPLDADQTKFHFSEEAPEFEFEIVVTGQTGLERLEKSAYNLLLLDHRLPDMDGLEVLRNLKQKGISIPVVYVTGAGDDELVVKALRAGVMHYVPKNSTYLDGLPNILRGVLNGHQQNTSQNSKEFKLLLLSSNPPDTQKTILHFEEYAPNYKIDTVSSSIAAIDLIKQAHKYDIIVHDINTMSDNGIFFGQEIRTQRLEIPPFIIISGQGKDSIALAALKLGAADYLTKNDDYLNKLIYAIEQVINHEQIRRANANLQLELEERKKVEKKLEERASQLSTLYEISQNLINRQDLPTLLNNIVESAMSVVNASIGFIDLYDPAMDDLVIIVSKGFEKISIGSRKKIGEGISGKVAQTRKPLIIPDYQSWENKMPEYSDIPISSFCMVPMLFSGELVGVLAVGELKPSSRVFSEADANFLSLLAGHASSVVNEARLQDETRQRIFELEAVNKISTALRRAHTVDEILPILIDDILSVIGTTSGMIWLCDSHSLKVEKSITRGWFSNLSPDLLLKLDGIPLQVIQTQQPFDSKKYKKETGEVQNIADYLPAGWGGVCLPIQTAEESIGLLFISVPLSRDITKGDVRLLSTLAEISGNAIQRIRLHAQTEQRLQRLTALNVVDTAMNSSLDVRIILGSLLDQLISQLKVNAADILSFNPSLHQLEYTIGKGFTKPVNEKIRINLDNSAAGMAIIEHRIISKSEMIQKNRIDSRADTLSGEDFHDYYIVPLITKGQTKGVLELYHREKIDSDQEWLDFLETLGNQAAIAIDNAELFQRLERTNLELGVAYDATIRGWSHALDLRDKETEGHTKRVAEQTEQLARMYGIPDEQIIHIRRGALLHDIGKMGIPDNILLKPDALTPAEWNIMRQHPQFAYDMLSNIAYLKNAIEIPLCHHEKWDGTGYPRGLKGTEIPVSARLFAMIDIWDALSYDRPYRKAWPKQKVLDHIQSLSGTQFDPDLVPYFFRLADQWE